MESSKFLLTPSQMYPAVCVEALSTSDPSQRRSLVVVKHMCSAARVFFLARTVQKPECCVNLILQQMEEEQYPGQYWQGRQQRERNGAGWWGSLKD